MRLLKYGEDGNFTLTSPPPDNIPSYAILSHTWGEDDTEVKFRELLDGSGRRKAGFEKIKLCGEQAKKDKLEYFWVDTCCIDKSNSTELSEAITSMYRWYQMASLCYVYLADVSHCPEDSEGDITGSPNLRSWKPCFRKSRWFTRGWTLQELLAPDEVVFFSKEWTRLGTKDSLKGTISDFTKIPIKALDSPPMTNFLTEERLRWAKDRVTKKKEDEAYCLMGIFGVFIPLMYGEGENAFKRLTEEIDKLNKPPPCTKMVNSSSSRNLDRFSQEDDSTDGHEIHNTTHGFTPKSDLSAQEIRSILLESLDFEQLDARRKTIKKAYASTCTWFLKHPIYLSWVDVGQFEHHRGFLWINGKPGAGKSTLMKFTHAHAEKTKGEDEIVIAFYFNARGDALEKSTLGMYRALLLDLLRKTPEIQDVLDGCSLRHKGHCLSPAWTIDLLRELLAAALNKLGKRRLKIFIDALDECDEVQIREMVAFFEEFGSDAVENGTRVYICFASRHYPTIDIRNGQKLILENEVDHGEDLAKYVQSHLRAGQSKHADEVRSQIKEMANGVFMWAVLVIDILNDEFRRGRIFAVKKKLQEIPAELGDLFKDILRKDRNNMSDLLLCLQWILFAKRPLRREEFYFAMTAMLDSDNITEWDREVVTVEDMSRFVLNSSKGLAEFTKSKTPTVQFIHESINDFLVKDNGLCELWPEFSENLYSRSQDQLKVCCQRSLSIDLSSYLPHEKVLQKATSDSSKELRQSLKNKFPFLEYAVQNVLYHADGAASAISQDYFLTEFDLRRWLCMSNVFANYDTHRHTLDATLLYILAEKNFARLLATNCQLGSALDVGNERHRCPLYAALANEHRGAVRALLQREGNSNIDSLVARLEFGQTYKIPKGQTPLLWVVKNGNEALAEVIATSKRVDIRANCPDLETADVNGLTALTLAVTNRNESLVRFLLQIGATANPEDDDDDTALMQAIRVRSESMVHLLLEYNANVNARNGCRQTALMLACQKGCESIVRQLLAAKANIKAKDVTKSTALMEASKQGNETIVRILLDSRAKMETRDRQGRTALAIAALHRRENIIHLLLGKGAAIEAEDVQGSTALMFAVYGKDPATVIRLLLEGADIQKQNALEHTPLSLAIRSRDKGIVQIILAWHSHIAVENKPGGTLLSVQDVVQMVNTRFHNLEAVDLPKSKCPSAVSHSCNEQFLLLEQPNEQKSTETSEADATQAGFTERETAELTKLFLAGLDKADVRFVPNIGIGVIEQEDLAPFCDLALLWASEWGWEELVSWLLTNGADIEIRCAKGMTALVYAAAKGRIGVVRLLLENMADIDTTDDSGTTVVLTALKGQHYDIVELLVSCGANITAARDDHVTALEYAVLLRDERGVRALLDDYDGPIEWDNLQELLDCHTTP